MSNHTPGPWFATGQRTKYVEARIGGGLIQEIASVGPTHADNGYGSQQQANARLIASAPDLLQALEAILDAHSMEWRSDDKTYLMAVEAIIYAKGDPS